MVDDSASAYQHAHDRLGLVWGRAGAENRSDRRSIGSTGPLVRAVAGSRGSFVAIAGHDRTESADSLQRLHREGITVEGSPAEWDPATYLQAGQALAGLLLPGEVSAVYYANLIERRHGYIDRADDLVSADQLEALDK